MPTSEELKRLQREKEDARKSEQEARHELRRRQ